MITKIRIGMTAQLGLLLAAFFILRAAFASSIQGYEVIPQSGGNQAASGMTFKIGYTFGTHDGQSSESSGSAQVTLDPLEIRSARFSVPIAKMSTGSALRDCHMRESLGIDYSRSRFPNEHICNSANELPAEGPDSVAFPTIDVEFVRAVSARSAGTIALLAVRPGQAAEFDAEVTLRVHGITQTIQIPIRVELVDQGRLRVKTQFDVKLADHGVVVKP